MSLFGHIPEFYKFEVLLGGTSALQWSFLDYDSAGWRSPSRSSSRSFISRLLSSSLMTTRASCSSVISSSVSSSPVACEDHRHHRHGPPHLE